MTRNTLFVLASAFLLSACPGSPDDEPVDNSIPPSFNTVMITNVTIDPVRTMTRPDEPDAAWSFNDGHPGLSGDDCYDLEVAPNAAQRFLAFASEVDDGQWRLSVRAGLGNNVWDSNHSELNISASPEFGCIQPYISHVKDDLYGVLWIIDGTLYSAAFVPNNPTGFELIKGDEEDSFFDGVSVQGVSLAYYNDAMRMIWMSPERDRIMQMRGQISSSDFLLDGIATYTPLTSTSHSSVIARDDGLYIAAADGSTVKLYRSEGSGTDWTEVASCDSDRQIQSSLLYVDQEGAVRTLLTPYTVTQQRTLSFEDCSRDVLQLPIGTPKRVRYSPGT